MSIGLVSSSFGKKNINGIATLLKTHKFDYIEWCACHVPCGDFENAKKAAELTQNAGAHTAQYSSSFKICENGNTKAEFSDVIKTAQILGTSSVCLRAGNINYEYADEAYISKFLTELEIISALSGEANISVSFSFLPNTLFDNYMTTINMFCNLELKNVFIDWQPNMNVSLLYSLFELKTLIKYVKNVHIFSANSNGTYCPLIENKDDWRQYINILRTKPRCLFLNHLGSEEELFDDVRTLRDILSLYSS